MKTTSIHPPPRSSPDQAVRLRSVAPKPKGDWQTVHVCGSWLNYSQKLGRLDAHCANTEHGTWCKMDRQIQKGVLGLQLLWLSKHTCCHVKLEHDDLKSECCEQECQGKRREWRLAFVALAKKVGGVHQEIVDHEGWGDTESAERSFDNAVVKCLVSRLHQPCLVSRLHQPFLVEREHC